MVFCLLAVPFWRCPPFCLGVFTFHLVFREQQKISESGRDTGVHSKLAKRTSGMSGVGRGGATHCTAIWGHGSCWQISNPNNNYTETSRDRRIESCVRPNFPNYCTEYLCSSCDNTPIIQQVQLHKMFLFLEECMCWGVGDDGGGRDWRGSKVWEGV